jgi:hypothetical protein
MLCLGNKSQIILGLVAASMLFCTGGCDSRKFNVSGKVTYNGSSLEVPGGEISFTSPKGEVVSGPIKEDGTYLVTNVTAGHNLVAVSYQNPKALKEKEKPRLEPGERMQPVEKPFLTPQKYASPNTSELSVDVDKDVTFDVSLTGPKMP